MSSTPSLPIIAPLTAVADELTPLPDDVQEMDFELEYVNTHAAPTTVARTPEGAALPPLPPLSDTSPSSSCSLRRQTTAALLAARTGSGTPVTTEQATQTPLPATPVSTETIPPAPPASTAANGAPPVPSPVATNTTDLEACIRLGMSPPASGETAAQTRTRHNVNEGRIAAYAVHLERQHSNDFRILREQYEELLLLVQDFHE